MPHLPISGRALTAVLLVAFATGCPKTDDSSGDPKSYLKASSFALKEIDYVVKGLKRADLPLEVHFKEPQAEPYQVDAPLGKDVFQLKPAVEGIAKWSGPKTLSFKPADGFTAGKEYRVIVDLAKVFPSQADAGTYEYKIEVAPRDLVKLDASFDESSTQVTLRGKIILTEEVPLKSVKRALALSEAEGDSVSLDGWSRSEGGYAFTATGFERGKITKRYILRFDGAEIGVARDKELKLDLRPESEFAVSSSGYEGTGDDAVYRFNMNAELAAQQKLGEFVTVAPAVEGLKVSYVGRSAQVSGKFKLGTEYTVTLKAGIASKRNTSLKENYVRTFTASDLPPSVEFSQAGVFLTSKANARIAFRATNVSRVRAEVHEVFANNVGQFLQSADLRAGKKDRNYFNVHPVGVQRHTEVLKLDPKRNRESQYVVDLRKVFEERDGVFIVRLTFNRNDLPFKCKKNKAGAKAEAADNADVWYWNGSDEYRKNPCNYGFWYSNGQIDRPIAVSDIGLTSKQTSDGMWAFATDLNTGAPLSGVKVTAFTYQNQRLGSAMTDGQGLARIPETTKGGVFYVEGVKGKQRTALKQNTSRLNLSTFDVGGAPATKGVSIFTYTERGVYRPGDPIHLTTIVRNREQTFPANHPVEVRLFNPKGKEHSRVSQKTATDGVYAFQLQTDVSDFTGNWSARVFIGGKSLTSHALRIETVVPPRLRAKLTPAKKTLRTGDASADLNIKSEYLFGAPAAQLRAEVKATVRAKPRAFPKRFPGFLFDASSVRMQQIQETIFNEKLSDEGTAKVSWNLPNTSRAPSDLTLRYDVKVYEKGGRFLAESVTVPIQPWNHYVGIKMPTGQVRVNEKAALQVVVADSDGKAIEGRDLKVRIYTNQHRWWWSRTGDYHERYKRDKETKLLFETQIKSDKRASMVKFTPKEYGELLFEVEDVAGGHTATGLMWTYGWRRPDDTAKAASLLSVQMDKLKYTAGETAELKFTAPGPSKALVTIERGGFILDHFWRDLPSADAKIAFPVRDTHGPNAYAFVHVLQPHGSVGNDKPIRSYGVVNFGVDDPTRELKVTMETPEEIRPRSSFSVKVTNEDSRDAQFTIAVVDEGLLSITNFKTPNAGGHFYAKQSIGVSTSDMYDQVIGSIWGDVTKRFAIGGDGDEGEERKQVNPVKAKRFEPVSLFQGPLGLKAGETREVNFKMPNYNGAVRVMVIAAHRGAYASVEESVPVRAPIVLLPTLPRVAGPGDVFDMPISVFGLKPDVGSVELGLKVTGPVEIVGDAQRQIDFKKIGEKEVLFRLKGKEAMGVATIAVNARAKKYSASYKTELAIRPASAVNSDHVDEVLKAGATLSMAVPEEGLAGSRSAELIVSTLPDLGFRSRASYLIRYPHGCLEQTTSAAFPQLYLREIFPDLYRQDDVDRNINAALDKIAGFQGSDGGFYYWRYWDYYRRPYADWGTSWVGHFMVEARGKGYYVSDRVMNKWLRYQRAHASVDPSMTNLYRLYTLALAGEPQVSLMNRVREQHKSRMSGPQLMLLAGAYQAAGMEGVASGLMALHETARPQLELNSPGYYDYYWRYSYGSWLRDTALELQVQTKLGNQAEAFTTYKQIAQKLSSGQWYSTHTLAWSLLAVGQFVKRFDLSNSRIQVEVDLPSGTKTVNSGANAVAMNLDDLIGKKVTVRSKAKSTLFVSVAYDYLPLRPDQEPVSENMAMNVAYRDEQGREVDPSTMQQGKSFWAIYRIASTAEVKIENVALTQILPAGWEIENTRLTGEAPPEWLRKGFHLGGETYMDLRDDRISWFFDLENRRHYYWKKHDAMAFAVKINTVGSGEFDAAPAFAEAMYDANYRARIPGRRVTVVRPQ